MIEKILLSSPQRCGKCIMQQQEWAVLKCKDCGGKFEIIESNEFEEIMQCKNCGRKTLLLKKLREEVE